MIRTKNAASVGTALVFVLLNTACPGPRPSAVLAPSANRSAAQLSALSDAEKLALSPGQITTIAPSHIRGAFRYDLLNQLKPEQLDAFTIAQLEQLEADDFGRILPKLSTQHYSHFSANLVEKIQPQNVPLIPEQKLRLIPAPALAHLSTASFNALQAHQTAQLTSEQLQTVPQLRLETMLSGLEPELPAEALSSLLSRIPADSITPVQISSVLTNVNSLPQDLGPGHSGFELNEVSNETFREVVCSEETSLIPFLNHSNLNLLALERFRQLPQSALSQLDPRRCINLTIAQFSILSQETRAEILTRISATLPTNEQEIQSCAYTSLELLAMSSSQLPFLSILETNELSAELLPWFTQTQIQSLTRVQLRRFSIEQIHALPAHYLTSSQLKVFLPNLGDLADFYFLADNWQNPATPTPSGSTLDENILALLNAIRPDQPTQQPQAFNELTLLTSQQASLLSRDQIVGLGQFELTHLVSVFDLSDEQLLGVRDNPHSIDWTDPLFQHAIFSTHPALHSLGASTHRMHNKNRLDALG